jgi:DNA-binding response OmpR family regulator
MRLLVVEDERKVADALCEGLQAEDYDVVVEHTGQGAFVRLTTDTFDMVLLDLGLPDRSGLELLATARQQRIRVPVLILTAMDAVEHRVAGLNAGADDYLVKPFAFAELLARIRALSRRDFACDVSVQVVGPLRIDLLTRRVSYSDESMDLTNREFELLTYLARYEGQVVSREALARDVWKEANRSAPLDNVIDVHIARLRRKVDRTNDVHLIHTIRGVGFMVRVGEP